MQNLILEILNAQPSLRDSKTYLNYFGPRVASGSKQPRSSPPPFHLQSNAPPPHQHLAHPGPPPPPPRPFGPPSTQQQDQDRFRQELLQPRAEQQQQQQSHANADSHQFAQPDIAVRATTAAMHELAPPASRSDAPVATGPEAALAESLSTPPIQQHTALVKIQGPFTERQLESIAEGMVYLKRLGLVSVIVIDSEDVAWRGATSHFDPDTGARVDAEANEAEQERKGLAPWLATASPSPFPSSSSSSPHNSSHQSSRLGGVGKGIKTSKARSEEALRKRMLSEVHRLSELLIEKGAPARPYSHPILRIDAASVKTSMQAHPPDLPGKIKAHPRYSWAERMSSLKKGRSGKVQQQGEDDDDATPIPRSPLVSDDGLSSMRSALAHDMIPVIAPLALFEEPEAGGAPRTTCVPADDVVVALAREMAAKAKQDDATSAASVDMMPLRLMVM